VRIEVIAEQQNLIDRIADLILRGFDQTQPSVTRLIESTPPVRKCHAGAAFGSPRNFISVAFLAAARSGPSRASKLIATTS